MKTTVISLMGDPKDNLYQLGKKERESYQKLQERIVRLLSANEFLRYGQDIISRARALLKKKDDSFFDQCIEAYAEGLGIEASEYKSFLYLFEIAAHYGQVYPELKGMLPGCTSLFEKSSEGFVHARLIDFPLVDIFNATPHLYYWKVDGKNSVMNYSCEGLAPVFFQTIHQSGFSMALHHKPGGTFHREGMSIFHIAFDTLFDAANMNDFRKELKKKTSVTKWGFYMMDPTGTVLAMDLDGPASNMETFSLTESALLVFNNIPIRHDTTENFDQYLEFCHQRQDWLKERMAKKGKGHNLDTMTDVKDQKARYWKHPSSTLSTVGAFQVNLSTGVVQVKEGKGALVASDSIIEFSLADQHEVKVLKAETTPHDFEHAWKEASLAQSSFDQGNWDEAYHHLQMAIALAPDRHWKEIFRFYLYVWDFKFVGHKRELSLIYRDVKRLEVPELLKNQWYFLCMRLEKQMGLLITVKEEQLAHYLREPFRKERDARPAVFATWMKLLYPRIEILDVFSPHHK